MGKETGRNEESSESRILDEPHALLSLSFSIYKSEGFNSMNPQAPLAAGPLMSLSQAGPIFADSYDLWQSGFIAWGGRVT